MLPPRPLRSGNVKKGAYAKLARGALDGSFGFGGFGCDAEDRTDLLRVGAGRRGADCIGVSTGGFEPRALLELGAYTAFASREALLSGR